jgi:hypothetical protein
MNALLNAAVSDRNNWICGRYTSDGATRFEGQNFPVPVDTESLSELGIRLRELLVLYAIGSMGVLDGDGVLFGCIFLRLHSCATSGVLV